jgi:glycosyltransferase involved in cell wall biosynthesis
MRRADLLHATSDAEYEEIRALGFTSPVAIIPNGIDVPDSAVQQPASRSKTLLFLGRIHPTKGIDTLLRAWGRLQASHCDWSLVIAGKGEPQHEAQLQRSVKEQRLDRISFPGPLYGGVKSAAYYDAGLFVLPSHSENFGIAVAEALAHGCPAVVSRGAPWAGLDREGCGWWVDDDVDALAQSLDSAMSLPPERLAAMGQKGRSWMERDFSWSTISAQFEEAYRWAIHGGETPRWVRSE